MFIDFSKVPAFVKILEILVFLMFRSLGILGNPCSSLIFLRFQFFAECGKRARSPMNGFEFLAVCGKRVRSPWNGFWPGFGVPSMVVAPVQASTKPKAREAKSKTQRRGMYPMYDMCVYVRQDAGQQRNDIHGTETVSSIPRVEKRSNRSVRRDPQDTSHGR